MEVDWNIVKLKKKSKILVTICLISMKESKESSLLNSGLPFQVIDMIFILYNNWEIHPSFCYGSNVYNVDICLKPSFLITSLLQAFLRRWKSLASYQNMYHPLPADGNLTQIVIQILSFMNLKYFHDFIPSLLGVY